MQKGVAAREGVENRKQQQGLWKRQGRIDVADTRVPRVKRVEKGPGGRCWDRGVGKTSYSWGVQTEQHQRGGGPSGGKKRGVNKGGWQ